MGKSVGRMQSTVQTGVRSTTNMYLVNATGMRHTVTRMRSTVRGKQMRSGISVGITHAVARVGLNLGRIGMRTITDRIGSTVSGMGSYGVGMGLGFLAAGVGIHLKRRLLCWQRFCAARNLGQRCPRTDNSRRKKYLHAHMTVKA